MGVVPVHSLPVKGHGLQETRGLGYNERPTTGTALLAVCMAYIVMLVGVQAYRAGRLAGHQWKIAVIDMLIFAQAFICSAFSFSVAIIAGGLGVATEEQCHAAIRLCVSFYGAGKMTMYLFLLERAHVVRAPFFSRTRDPIWIIGMLVIVLGFGGLIIYEQFSAHAAVSDIDGLCRIGISQDASIAVMAMDTAVNFGLNGIFIWLLMPVLRSRAHREDSYEEQPEPITNAMKRLSSTGTSILGILKYPRRKESGTTPFHETVKDMLWRNVIGAALILMLTLANNLVFLTVEAAQLSHVCLLTCLSDVTWSVLITNWLWLRSSVQPQTSELMTSASTGSAASRSVSPHRRQSWSVPGGQPLHRNNVEKKRESSDRALQEATIHEK